MKKIIVILCIVLGVGYYVSTLFDSVEDKILGTWHTELNGQDLYWIVSSDGMSTYHISAYGQSNDIRSSWRIENGVLYERLGNGQSAKGNVEFISDDYMKITVIDNGVPQEKGQTRYYSRYVNTGSSNPSFTGRKYDCERCLCRGYVKKSTYNSDCKVCGHPKSWHYSQK